MPAEECPPAKPEAIPEDAPANGESDADPTLEAQPHQQPQSAFSHPSHHQPAPTHQDALSKADILPLIINQLQSYNYVSLAQIVAEATDTPLVVQPSERLAQLCALGQRMEETGDDPSMAILHHHHDASKVGSLVMDDTDEPSHAAAPTQKPAPTYMSWYTTLHKGSVFASSFSVHGQYIASGGSDSAVKVLDVSRCKAIHAAQNDKHAHTDDSAPVIRNVTDHNGYITDVAFHPNNLVLASCSDDKHIKMFDLQKLSMKRSFRYLQDSHPINSISFHASGDFLLVATTHEYPRLYDIATFQCYRPSAPSDAHASGISCARYAPQGTMFATCGGDGCIKIYDGINGKCVNTIERAHGGSSVSSVKFSKSGRYLLSSGQDSVAKLWDVTMGRAVCMYEGASQKNHNINATFTYNEDYVISTDESALTINIWDARTGTPLRQLSGGHTDLVSVVAASPVDPCFISGSHDGRVRFWDLQAELKS
ncbi:hypothetical protein SeLEV6574_g05057 [Synchytrium endobioticum]|uniref:Cleavage stimulation factor 50 kDa subunit n=1 Tax=Synchytrium endobioticum TaxID=286115 RepID=A0A507CW90_9FUNG|nr:hypothetical protein SeLEV6574_g05057 [Synchytrium endobioticum]